jgi:hypothetical protein
MAWSWIISAEAGPVILWIRFFKSTLMWEVVATVTSRMTACLAIDIVVTGQLCWGNEGKKS